MDQIFIKSILWLFNTINKNNKILYLFFISKGKKTKIDK